LNNLAAMALNQEYDGIECVSPEKLHSFDGIIFDVREVPEIKNLPLVYDNVKVAINQLQVSFQEIDKSRNILVICQKGSRAYEAARKLKNSGFENPKYLGGGIEMALGKIESEE